MVVDSEVADVLTFQEEFTDAFGNLIAHNVRNTIDILSTDDFGLDRLLLFIDGSRTDPGDSGFSGALSDNPATYGLTPAAGEKVELRTRERLLYVPGFQLLDGIGWRMASDLPTGGVIRVGLRIPGENEFRTEYQSDGTVQAQIRKGGTETVASDISDGILPDRDSTYQEKLKQPKLSRDRNNMYGVGNYVPGLSYLQPIDTGDYTTADDEAVEQRNENPLAKHIEANADGNVSGQIGVGNTSAVNSEEFTLPLSIELDLTNASSGGTLNVLSSQGVVLGDVKKTVRAKPVTHHDLGGNIDAGFGNDALLGLRVNPNRVNVPVELTNLRISPTDQMDLLIYGFNPTDLTFSDSNFLSPLEHNADNSVIQENGQDAGSFAYPTTSVTDPEDGSSVTVPDGRLITSAAQTGGSASEGATVVSGGTETIELLYGDEIALLIPRGGSAVSGASINVTSWDGTQNN